MEHINQIKRSFNLLFIYRPKKDYFYGFTVKSVGLKTVEVKLYSLIFVSSFFHKAIQ